MLKGVNWIAVVVAVVLLQGLGMAWYGPLFGKAWLAALGHNPPGGETNLLMGLGVVNSLIVVLGLAWLNRRLGAATLGAAVTTAPAAWVAFAFTTQALEYLYMGMSRDFVLINMGYLLAAYLVAGATLALVRLGAPAAQAAAA
jgi:hypothetical protein